MRNAVEIRVGNIIRVDGKTCKVLSQEIRGTGKFGKTVHLKVRNVEDGNMQEKSFRAEDKVDDVELHRVKMQYLYKDGAQLVFMNMESFEQFQIQSAVVGKQEVFLKENIEIDILFEADKALSIDFPKVVELKVTRTAPPIKGVRDTTYKEAELENGLKLLVPQFVKEGEMVRVNVDDLSYRDRVTTKSLGGVHEEKEKKESRKERES
ncbi:MAG: hypothetical protein A3G87_03085 [Omnitrophica bacterium RIFCSPLOWO2_12_FULL_50_11]|nr:MAG: hypothetical protein A3G87_03085 [Omnitrophica bacterium RIFCSPLOWO2_12_FULL_50_11]